MLNNKYLKPLSILIVEDDIDSRRFLKNALFEKFKEVRDVENGKKALELYKSRSFDIVLSDIRMPEIDGVELSKSILKINPNQHIIIVSAYSEAESIIELLNTGVEKFILKPVDPKILFNMLNEIGKNIYNENLVKEQQQMLEDMSIKLIEKNKNLEKAIRIFETKIKQTNLLKSYKKKEIEKKPQKQNINIKESILDDHIHELIELEDDIEASTSIMFLKEKFDEKELNKSIIFLKRYAQILTNYSFFSNLGENILTLANELSENIEVDIEIQKIVLEYLESLIFTLVKWRKEIFDGNLEDPNTYDNSIICDINTISLALHNKLNEVDSNIEFF